VTEYEMAVNTLKLQFHFGHFYYLEAAVLVSLYCFRTHFVL